MYKQESLRKNFENLNGKTCHDVKGVKIRTRYESRIFDWENLTGIILENKGSLKKTWWIR